MGAYESTIFNGTPGKRFTNNTGEIQYQFVCALDNTCGTCLQYHLAIGPWWPIPLHRRCACHQELIFPGEKGKPFVNFRDTLKKMTHEQQVAAIGASNYELLQKKVITWEDVVTEDRVLDLKEVVAKKKLTVDQMVKAGVKPRFAKEAYETVHSPAADLLAARRAELLAKIRGAGMSDEQIKQAVREGVKKRVLASGPSGEQVFKPKPGPPPPTTFLQGSPDWKSFLPIGGAAEKKETILGAAERVDLESVSKSAASCLFISGEHATADSVREVLQEIHDIHGVPIPTPVIPATFKEEGSYRGRYVTQIRKSLIGADRIRPQSINVSPTGSTPHLTAAHEFGHFNDHAVIPGGENNARVFAKDPIFKEWMDAVRKSNSIATLAEKRTALKSIAEPTEQHTKTLAYVNYLMQGDECWARSYAQWIATKSGNKQLLKDLAKDQSAAQWTEKDFAPIAEAIDRIYERLGLLKFRGPKKAP